MLTDGQTDGWTIGRTDRQTHMIIQPQGERHNKSGLYICVYILAAKILTVLTERHAIPTTISRICLVHSLFKKSIPKVFLPIPF